MLETYSVKNYESEKILMNCPVCKTPELISTDLESNLTSFRCTECGGNWIRGAEYWKWLEVHGPNLPERNDRAIGLFLSQPRKHVVSPSLRFRVIQYLVYTRSNLFLLS